MDIFKSEIEVLAERCARLVLNEVDTEPVLFSLARLVRTMGRSPEKLDPMVFGQLLVRELKGKTSQVMLFLDENVHGWLRVVYLPEHIGEKLLSQLLKGTGVCVCAG